MDQRDDALVSLQPEHLANGVLDEAQGRTPVRGQPTVCRTEQHGVDRAGRRMQFSLVDVWITRENRGGKHERRRPPQLDRFLFTRELLDPAADLGPERAETPRLRQLV